MESEKKSENALSLSKGRLRVGRQSRRDALSGSLARADHRV
jgi:hypothetical protein